MNKNGTFYGPFVHNTEFYGPEDKRCIEQTVEHLLRAETSTQHPGMLLGKIQSGKTKTFLAVMGLAFDNGFDIAIVLTKGTKALTKQTVERVRRQFAAEQEQDLLQVFDIMAMPPNLTGYELDQKLVIIAKKQSDNLNRLKALFEEQHPQLAERRVLMIDDEADFASIGFKMSRSEGLQVNTTTQQIDQLRHVLQRSSFLQVTATPYALYLQPEDFVVNGMAFHPVRPAFTELVPVHDRYIGSDYYFERSQEDGDIARYLFRPVSMDEMNILKRPDRRRFKVEEALNHQGVEMLRRAICTFIVGGVIRRLQETESGSTPKKYSFLIHTEAARASHAWQEQVVMTLNDLLKEAARDGDPRLNELFSEAYAELSASLALVDGVTPPLNDVLEAARQAMLRDSLMITVVNSEREVEALLDSEGQLRLRTPLNIFIGGQILDRGVTISNLIGFYYGRRPNVHQQDTVLQHSRMFGYRPIEDLAVTRFYTAPLIHEAMRRMHESDVALRETIEHDPERKVIFIQKDTGGRIVPCSPNKILISRTTTLRPFRRILPIGFQTDYQVRVGPIIQRIDARLQALNTTGDPRAPFLIPIEDATELLEMIERTLQMADGYSFDWEACKAAMTYMAQCTTDTTMRDRVWCLVRSDRNTSRFINQGGQLTFADAPDTTHQEGRIARDVATENPMLMLFRQNGSETNGWRNAPFYWPVVVAQQRVPISIFAHETYDPQLAFDLPEEATSIHATT
jgi:hypothetical protein